MQVYKLNATSKDGYLIPAVTTFHADMAPAAKGLVIICHGFGEYSGRYLECMERLLQANYASIAFDQRGHGKLGEVSEKKRSKKFGVIPGYESFMDDLDALVAAANEMAPNLPLVLYGHSMGGNIAANYLLKRGQAAFACAVLESPWLGLYNELSPIKAFGAKALGRLSSKWALVQEDLKTCDVTCIPENADSYEKDPLYHKRISYRMASGILKACAYALDNASALSIPTFIAIANNERIVSNPAIKAFCDACGDIVTLKEYDSYHSIHNDINRDAFFSDISDFLDKIV